MAGLLIFLLASFLLFYYLTRIVWVRIIKAEKFKIEIHLPILSLHFTKKSKTGDENQKKKRNTPSFFGYFRIITGVAERIKDSKIIVKQIVLPIKSEDFDKSAILRPLRQQALICAFIAYMRTKAKTIILKDDAITLSPDVQALQCYITVKLRLYQLIYGLLSVRHAIYEENKREKGERKHVRE